MDFPFSLGVTEHGINKSLMISYNKFNFLNREDWLKKGFNWNFY